MLGAGRGLVETDVEGAAAGGTDGSGGVGTRETDAFVRDAVHVGGLDEGMSVTAEFDTEIVAEDPEDVRPAVCREEGRGHSREC